MLSFPWAFAVTYFVDFLNFFFKKNILFVEGASLYPSLAMLFFCGTFTTYTVLIVARCAEKKQVFHIPDIYADFPTMYKRMLDVGNLTVLYLQ